MSTTRALLPCDDAPVPADVLKRTWTYQKPIYSTGRHDELTLRADSLAAVVLQSVDDRAADLVHIAAYVYAADQVVSRGGPADVYGSKWRREMTLCLPVSDPDFWQQAEVHQALANTLGFLTDDEWEFHFSPARAESHQIPLHLEQETVLSHPNSVVLFSGGADSLSTVVEEMAARGNRPVIVSHRSAPQFDARQRDLADQLRHRFPQWGLPHLSFWIHRRGSDAADTSQRTRGFVFASLGAAVASQLGITRVLLGDNGVVSLNLPINAQLVGALASRATHPEFLRRFNVLSRLVFPANTPLVENPLALKTRAETFEMLDRLGSADLIRDSLSCSHPRNRPKESPQCGYCSQCLDRRFGAIAAGLEEHDLKERYRLDVFTQPLPRGEPRTVSESLIRFARRVVAMAPEEVYLEFPQIADAVSPDESDIHTSTLQLIDLVQRHARQVLAAVNQMISRHSADLATGALPDDCLLRLVIGGRHQAIPHEPVGNQFIHRGRVWSIAFEGWETQVQDLLGMAYIARLLRHPHQSFHAADLSSNLDALAPPSTYRAVGRFGDDVHIEGSLNDPLLDDETRASVARRLNELAERREQAETSGDMDALEQIDHETAAIRQYLGQGTGLGGRSRRFMSADERARHRVTKAIKRTQDAIDIAHPPLSRHLTAALHSGMYSEYRPESPVEWTIQIDDAAPRH